MGVPVALRDRGKAAPPGLAANRDVTQGRERRVAPPDEVKVTREAELTNNRK